MIQQALQQKYHTEIERLDEEHRDLERLWTQVPRFALVALLSIPVGITWGWGAAVVELLVSAALVGTRAYLIAIRKTENRWTREKLVNDLDAQMVAPSNDQHTTSLRIAAA